MKIRTVILALCMLIGGGAAFWWIPKSSAVEHAVNLEAIVPNAFGDWHVLPNVRLVTAQDPGSLEQELYSQVLTRAFSDSNNHVVMLLLAYGPSQTDRLQLHRPEICYVANGFRIGSVGSSQVDIYGVGPLSIKRLIATRESRVEYITYWMRIGDKIVNSVLRRQLTKLEYGLKGIIPDGLLVRTSVVGSPKDAFEIQDRFLNALAEHASAPLRAQLFGGRH